MVGEGRSGKTALIRALRNLPFEDMGSTAGVATSTLETTALHKWVKSDGSNYQKVSLYRNAWSLIFAFSLLSF